MIRNAMFVVSVLCLVLAERAAWGGSNTIFDKGGGPSASSQASCQPSRQTLAPVPCGEGWLGVKFPLRVKSCPDGVVTEGREFDRDNCRKIGAPDEAIINPCKFTPTGKACQRTPAMQGCPIGTHWTTLGTGIAHCVRDDFPCDVGHDLIHDQFGQPSCKQVLCPQDRLDLLNCPNGESGVAYQRTSYRRWGNQCVAEQSIDTSSCINCVETSTQTRSCDFANARGNTFWQISMNRCTGKLISETLLRNDCSCDSGYTWDGSACVQSCKETESVEQVACPAGMIGVQTRLVWKNSCGGGIRYGETIGKCEYDKKDSPESKVVYSVLEFISFEMEDPSRCSKQSWLLGFLDGNKISEVLQSKLDGYVEQGSGMCILY